MPKQTIDIVRFNSGTITNPSEQDIPIDAASYSENIDSSNEDGKLKGIGTDSTKLSGATFGDKLTEFALLTNGTQYDVVAYSTDNELRSINDFYGTPALGLNSASQISDDNVTMQVTNHEVHVGMGSGSTHVTKWVGRIDDGQFDGSAPSGYQIDDAELKPPVQLPNFHKTVVIGSYLYGIEFEGKKIYKINKSTGAIESTSDKTFVRLQAICVHDSSYIWVYDYDVNDGTLYKVAISDLTVTIYSTVTDTTGDGFIITDMHLTTNKMWFYYYRSTGFGTVGVYPASNYTTASITNGSTISLNPVGFDISNGAVGAAVVGEITNTAATSIKSFKTGLVSIKSNADQIGYLLDFNGTTVCEAAGTTDESINTAIVIAKETVVSATLLGGRDGAGVTSNTAWSTFEISTTSYAIRSGIQLNNTYTYFNYANSNDTLLRRFDSPVWTVWDAIGNILTVSNETSVTNGTFTTLYNATITGEYSGSQYLLYALSSANGGRFAYKATDAGVVVYVKNSTIYMDTPTVIASGGDFAVNTRVYYKVSLLYDGFQESPLSDVVLTVDVLTVNDALQHTIKVFTPTTLLSKRVSHINLYRADTLSLTGQYPTGFYRLVNTFKLDKTWIPATDTNWGAYYVVQFLDTNIIGQSYDAITGISETLQDTMVNYEISTQLNSEHFVGICYHPEITDAKRYIFKSKPFCFDQFDWSTDFVILPRQPIAIASFNGRIYAFDENTTWRINPQGMYIEDTYEGIGCINKHAVVVTEYGMFSADRNSIYRYGGSESNSFNPIDIGYPIAFGNSESWQNAYFTDKAIFTQFDSKRKTVCFFFKTTSTAQGCWAYNIIKQRWDYWVVTAATPIVGTFSGKSGEIFYSDNTDVKEFLSVSGTRRAWIYETKQLSLDNPTKYKKWYKTAMNKTGTISQSVDFDNTGSYTSLTVVGNEATLSKTRAKTAKFKLSGASGTNEVDSFQITVREYIGESQTQ